MMYNKRLKKLVVAAGDLFFLYLSLFITLTLRYGSWPTRELWSIHQLPFLFVYLVWIVIFYIAGLYDIEKFLSVKSLRNEIFKTMVLAGILTTIIFYLVPFFGITPKTNLIINLFISFVFIWLWRKNNFNKAIKGSKIKVFFLGKSKETDGFAGFLDSRPQLGYATVGDFSSADLIVAPEEIRQDQGLAQILYKMILEGRNIVSFEKFYESITGKIPVSMISEIWFLENLVETEKTNYEKAKRVMDVFFSVIFLAVFMIIYPFAAIAIKMNSKGPIFLKQKRVGKNEKEFDFIKFRSMVTLSPDGSAEKNISAGWKKPDKNDSRITFVGNILRKTRIDELPQIWNILKGEMSFIGPRPERPEFVEQLKTEVPHYSMRHLVRPGATGWNQINFGNASARDAQKKLQYDLYYIKNRSLLFDLIITLKTIAVILRHSGR